MRRWNGWGDDATSMILTDGARAMLAERLGPGLPGQDEKVWAHWSPETATIFPFEPLSARESGIARRVPAQ